MLVDHKAARDLLAFYAEAGVDALVGDAPADHFAEEIPATPVSPAAPTAPATATPSAKPPLNRARPQATPTASATVLPPPDAAALEAREAAKRAASLDELRAIMNAFQGCALRQTAKQLVFADGNPAARVMFVGEAPGRDEDLAGLPFVGRSGKLLDRMLAAIGLDRTSAYITNIIPWRPPGNRDPSVQETQICLPFILRHIELVDPDFLVCLGKPSAQTLLGVTEGIKRVRGRWMPFSTGSRDIRAMATLHPAYLLRSPLEKRLAWRDFVMIRQALASGKPRT